MVVSLENLGYLGAGFGMGVLVCVILARTGVLFFSTRMKQLSDQALFQHASRFMEMADNYFKGYVREAKKDFSVQGQALRQSMDPVRQTLDQYETRLQAMEAARERANGAIFEKLAQMGRVQHQLHLETGNLVKALRLPHVRGRWGEITLRKVAELAGMARYCDFAEQPVKGTKKGSLRPDMVVTLPSNRQIVVDAKVPLMAYLDALEASDEQEKHARMADHARQVAAHINQLSSKNYSQAFSPAPEFVVLFIPGENFFSAALSLQPDLIEQGVRKGVILATPTTLIALLKSVAYAWQQKEGIENAEEIRTLGVKLYRRLCAMAESMNHLGKDIEKCAKSFNRTVKVMEKQVMPPARDLDRLGLATRELPDLETIDPSDAGTTPCFYERPDHEA
ncbi:MAG: DNA recombination protein RmuC [Desulfotignum sp.]|nr:DNA recombination protein RmuC [Desulfotignum sp.]MCF8112910.1 DNA recombination protein RmuC [Desulfotignum sp.]MCF8126358.1 DNA recombination protein RmuC [Desulfotignum sp.]